MCHLRDSTVRARAIIIAASRGPVNETGSTHEPMHPVAYLVGKGATRQQALAVIVSVPALVAAPLGLWFVDHRVGEAVVIVIAVSAPRAALALVARWGRSGGGPMFPEPRSWPALRGH